MLKKINIASLFSGFIFAIGLGISGMMNPEKVKSFLDLTGKWDPSLAFVMGGGLFITFITYPLILKRNKPILEDKFILPTKQKIDNELLIGSFLFGVGWGIGGLCPGSALANIATLNPNIILFVISMIFGFFMKEFIESYLSKKKIS